MQIAIQNLQFARLEADFRPALRMSGWRTTVAVNPEFPAGVLRRLGCVAGWGAARNNILWKAMRLESKFIPIREPQLAGELLSDGDWVIERIL